MYAAHEPRARTRACVCGCVRCVNDRCEHCRTPMNRALRDARMVRRDAMRGRAVARGFCAQSGRPLPRRDGSSTCARSSKARAERTLHTFDWLGSRAGSFLSASPPTDARAASAASASACSSSWCSPSASIGVPRSTKGGSGGGGRREGVRRPTRDHSERELSVFVSPPHTTTPHDK